MLSAKKGFGENSIDSVNHTWIWAFMKAANKWGQSERSRKHWQDYYDHLLQL